MIVPVFADLIAEGVQLWNLEHCRRYRSYEYAHFQPTRRQVTKKEAGTKLPDSQTDRIATYIVFLKKQAFKSIKKGYLNF